MVFVSALIPAAGSGERLGMGPKAFVDLCGKTLLERSVEHFLGIADELIVAVPESHLEHPVTQRLRTLPNPKPRLGTIRFIVGGATRQETVHRLLLEAIAPVVLIHDAARPFLPPEVTKRVLAAVADTGAATAALPCADTLVLEHGEAQWGEVVDRSKMRAVQTPQGFHRELLLEAHARATLEGIAATDDAGLVARLGKPVALALGDERLFKVTRPGDWMLAQAFAPLWDAANIGVGATGMRKPLRGDGA
jgi:2-C-methyl-D-erythritol 4-phosphate cytidylyltransferase